ncbi:MAG: carbohydrate ABC transporter substrate-binding protein [Chloroflexia bacterium]|nr:carbohydrate ABC transporter substrate-binding protein [Chloroflexia bacterium]
MNVCLPPQPRLSRRRFLSLAAAASAVPILTGCADTFTSDDEDGITLNLWYWNRSILDGLFPMFEGENAGIRVNNQKIGGSYGSAFRTTLAGKAFVPDVAALNVDVATYFPAEDQFEDLQELGATAVKDQYLEWKWQAGVTSSGKMIAFPMDTGPTALFYRADLFDQAGLPSEPADVEAAMGTWEDFFQAGAQLSGALPEVSLTTAVPNILGQVISQGADVYVSRDNAYIGNQDHMRRAWDIAAGAKRLGVAVEVDPFTPDWSAAMNNGRVATFVGAVWMKQPLLEGAPDTAGNWRVARPPGGAGNNGGSFMAIPTATNHAEDAYRLVEFLQSPANQLRAYSELSLFPSTPEVFDTPEMNHPEPFYGGQNTTEVFAAVAREIPNYYFDPSYNIVNGILMQEITNVASLDKDPDVAWDDAQSRIRRELAHKMPSVALDG